MPTVVIPGNQAVTPVGQDVVSGDHEDAIPGNHQDAITGDHENVITGTHRTRNYSLFSGRVEEGAVFFAVFPGRNARFIGPVFVCIEGGTSSVVLLRDRAPGSSGRVSWDNPSSSHMHPRRRESVQHLPPNTGEQLTPKVRKQLRRCLGKLINDRETIEMIAEDVGLEPTRLDLSGTPELVWKRVLAEAGRENKLAALLLEVKDRYPHSYDWTEFEQIGKKAGRGFR